MQGHLNLRYESNFFELETLHCMLPFPLEKMSQLQKCKELLADLYVLLQSKIGYGKEPELQNFISETSLPLS